LIRAFLYKECMINCTSGETIFDQDRDQKPIPHM
jgi:hypothetical protein